MLVKLAISTEPIRVNKATTFNWTVAEKDTGKQPQLQNKLDSGHNILIVHEDEPDYIWNLHGDRSVESISIQAGFPALRHPTTEDPFKYTFWFPKPGLWLLHFEIGSIPMRFWVEVKE